MDKLITEQIITKKDNYTVKQQKTKKIDLQINTASNIKEKWGQNFKAINSKNSRIKEIVILFQRYRF